MRASIVALMLVAHSMSAHAISAHHSDDFTVDPNDDDPKCARGECRPFYAPPLDEPDPKLSLGLRLRPPTTHLEVSYRYLAVRDPFGGSLPFHLVELDGYPVSRYVRVGLSATGGASTRRSAWMANVGFSIGVQYPWRVTPFLDLRFVAGVIGAYIVDRSVVSYEFHPALEGGIDVFLKASVHLVVAVGWAHPIYGGVDANKIQTEVNAGQSPVFDVHNVGYDTVTVRAGLGF
jgi:hypothetical protein